MGKHEKKNKSRRSRRQDGPEATPSEIRELLDDAKDDQPKRRSVQLRKDDNFSEDETDITVDDSSERETRRKEIEETDKISSSLSEGSPSKSLPNLTNDEWEEHMCKCMQLFNKNKVNVKNAFKLRIIDYMQLIFLKKSEKTDNLPLMSSTLDASAKVYAVRVDKVYDEVLKVVSGKDYEKDDDSEGNASGSDKEQDDANNFDDEDGNNPRGKKKKQQQNLDDVDDLDLDKFIAKDKRQIDKNDAEKNEGESLIKDRTTLPDGLEYFLELPINDNCEILLNGPVFPPTVERSKEKDIFIKIGPRWCGTEVSLDRSEYLPQYKDLHKSFYMIGEGEENVAVDKALMFVDDIPKIIDSSPIDEDEDMREEPEYCGDYDDHLIGDDEPDEVSILPTPLALQDQTPSLQVSSCQPSFSVQAMSNLVSASRNEYSFFDSTKVQFWKPPSHWSIKKKMFKSLDKKENKKPVKKTGLIDFNVGDMSEFKNALSQKDGGKLGPRTIKAWSADKTEPVDLQFSIREVVSLYSNDRLSYVDKDYNFVGASVEEEKEVQVPVIEECERMGGGLEDDGDGDDDRDVFMPEEAPPSPLSEAPLLDAPTEAPTESVLIPQDTNELIEAPAKVAQIAITYARTQKKIDMKLLKSTMWGLLNFAPTESSRLANEQSNFSDVYQKLKSDLPKEDSKALSFPIAYMALLHLSNEKSLYLKKNENDDIIVQVAVHPNSSAT